MERWLGANSWGYRRDKTKTVPALEALPVGQGREQQTTHGPASLQHSFLSILQSTGRTSPREAHSSPATLLPYPAQSWSHFSPVFQETLLYCRSPLARAYLAKSGSCTCGWMSPAAGVRGTERERVLPGKFGISV